MNMESIQKSMRPFYTVWTGQFISTFGSALTSFALSIWIYAETRSAAYFSFTLLAAMLPRVLFSPFAGAIADKYNRRLIMILSDVGAALSTLFIAVFVWNGGLRLEHILIANFINATCNTFQSPAYLAAIGQLVSKEKLGNANGMIQLADAFSRLLAPAIAGAAFVGIGLRGVLLIDFVTFFAAIVTLTAVRFPTLTQTAQQQASSMWQQIRGGWHYLKQNRGLLHLILFFAIINLFGGMIAPLIGPLLLELTTPEMFGYLSSLTGLGMVAGTLYVSVRGLPKRHILTISASLTLMGGFVLLLAFPSLWILGIGFFLTMMMIPIASTATITILQTQVMPQVQGRVFSLFNMLNWTAPAVAAALAGPIAERYFEPLLLADGALANSVGSIIGTGPGRGIGLMFVIIGACIAVTAVLAYFHAPIRQLELPPATDEVVAGGTAVLSHES